ncbi:unnamed protein product [marine sediment metagenome]|uniref:Uncharacterized protein n=1 Tax=marine sediment metagenome TaxID=412755 RepID=X0SJ08_9ZZZZ
MISDKELSTFIQKLAGQKEILQKLLDSVNEHWGEEDLVYRFYHQSFKVYGLQRYTLNIVEELKKLAPEQPMNKWFLQILDEGTGISFERDHNQRWLKVTRPILEAFWHAKYMLEQAVKYGGFYDTPPRILESGFAALLCLYGWR